MLLPLVVLLSGSVPGDIERLRQEPPRAFAPAPEYPADAPEPKREVDILVEVIVARDGRVEFARSGMTSPPFSDAADKAVQSWRYAPSALRRRFLVRVTFRIPDRPVHHLSPDAVLEQARSQDAEERAEALREIQDRGDALFTILASELAHADPARRCAAVTASSLLGPRARPLGPRLLDLLGPEEVDRSCRPGAALFAIDEKAFDDALARAVRARDAARCRAIVHDVLAEDDPAPRALGTALTLPGCRKEAAEALLFSTDPATAPDVLRALEDASPEGRKEIVSTLQSLFSSGDRERMKPFEPRAATALTAALRDPDGAVRGAAADALQQLGPAGAPAVEALITALRDPDPYVRWRVVQVLAGLGRLARAAGPALLALRRDLPSLAPSKWRIDEELDRAIEATGASRNEAQLQAEDEIRASVVEYALTNHAGGATPTFAVTAKGDPEMKGLRRALAARGLKPSKDGHRRLHLGTVEWTAGDMATVTVEFGNGIDSSGNSYVVALRDGRWAVVGTRGGWISEGPTPPGSRRAADAPAACRRAAPGPAGGRPSWPA